MIERGHWKRWVFITFTSIRFLKKPNFKTCASLVRKSPICDVMDASKPVCPWQLTSYSLPDCTLSKSTDIPESSASFVTPFDLAYSWGRCCCVYTSILAAFIFEKRNFLFGGTTGAISSFWNRTSVRWGVSETTLPLKSEKRIGDREIRTKRSRSNWGTIKLHTARPIAFFYWVTILVVYGCISGVWRWLILVLIEWVMSVISNLQGAGESGKSTIVKQMRILHDVHGFTEQWVLSTFLSQLFSIQIIRSEEGSDRRSNKNYSVWTS